LGSKNFEVLGSLVALWRSEIQTDIEIRILRSKYYGIYLKIFGRIEIAEKNSGYMQVWNKRFTRRPLICTVVLKLSSWV